MTPGSRLGSYEIAAQIGAGGMGEVYRARDTRLNRDVAVKLLPDSFAADPDRLRRFELEAQAAGGLNHPNVIVVHDVGVHAGRAYTVTELLEGESLRERLRAGKLPLGKATDYARQAADGLAAAHARGIVHRDIKPDNLWITPDGRVKILDFGLAKVAAKSPREESATVTVATDPGSVLGTLGYMAPEQVRGKDVDHRADIFSLGCVLYEMLTGERAFHGETAADTMSAILTKDPLEAPPASEPLPPHLERIVRHCLEKSPDERFQSARDLAFDLGSVTATSAPVSATGMAVPMTPQRRWLRPALAGALVLAAVVAAYLGGMRMARLQHVRFERLTYRRGVIQAARFAPDGRTVVYAAAWDTGPVELYTLMPGSPESRPLGVPPGGLFSVTSGGEVILGLGGTMRGSFLFNGTLAQVPMVGGTPREILDDITAADYSPVTREYAVVPAWPNGKPSHLEYPPGKTLLTGSGTSWQSHIRISPKGDMVAFADHYYFGDDGEVAVVDRAGNKRVLTERFTTLQGVAWNPSGDEIWFTGGKEGTGRSIYAVTLAGKQRLIAAIPGTMTLHDISSNGAVLLCRNEYRAAVELIRAGSDTPVDISWMDWAAISGLSSDGSKIVMAESGEGVHGITTVFLRDTDGKPSVRIGESGGGPPSPDSRWILSRTDVSESPAVVLLPARAGSPRRLDGGSLESMGARMWMPDSRRVVFSGREKGRRDRCYIQGIDGGKPIPFTAEGESCFLLVPDGSAVLTTLNGAVYLHPIGGGGAKLLPFKREPDYQPVQISSDGRWLYVQHIQRLTIDIYRVELATGRRELWKQIRPINPVGIRDIGRTAMTPDGKTIAYRVTRDLGELYLAEGLR